MAHCYCDDWKSQTYLDMDYQAWSFCDIHTHYFVPMRDYVHCPWCGYKLGENEKEFYELNTYESD